jgi:acyl-CoA reductase-like NAD-dependent aldehyde dehydrogenase
MNAPATPAARDELRSFDEVFIGGEWLKSVGDQRINVISPSTEEEIASVPAGQPGDIDRGVAAARRAFDSGAWSDMPAADRARLMRKVADNLDARRPDLVHAFISEVGMPLVMAEASAAITSHFWRRDAELAELMDIESARQWGDGAGVVRLEPVGVIGAIAPWNGAVGAVSMKVSPALAAGCTVVAKPAWEAPTSSLILAEAIKAAELPPGAVSIIPGGRETGEHLVRHPGVDKVSITGSTAAGRRVMELCAGRIARVTLELGGKSAAIIADDIPMESIVASLIPGSIGFSGQVCAALTRLLVSEERHDEIVETLANVFNAIPVGDPFEATTGIGPLISERQRDRVENYIAVGRAEGAKLVAGGGRPAHLDRGWYVEPTLFTGVSNDMRIAREEIFGPVVCVLTYKDLDDAVAIANDSDYGLSGAVYANDLDLAGRLARRIRTGQVFINGAGTVLDAPFGGYKQSGIGREGGPEGLQGFLETKLIVERGGIPVAAQG